MSNSDKPDPADATDANRRMWEATALVHERRTLDRLLASFAGDPAFSTLDALERDALERIGVEGRDVIQLSCNNGRELVSVGRMGARRVVGVDIVERYVEHGRRLAEAAGSEAAGVEAEFLRADVHDLPARLDGAFDVVYVTVGAIGWMPDLDAWYGIVARLLRPGGSLLLYEMHPVLDLFDAADGLTVKRSYFDPGPIVEDSAPDYLAPDETVEGASYWYHHTLGDVIGGAIRAGLEPVRFEEPPHDVSSVFRAFQDLATPPPMSYLLVARKKG